MRFYPYEKYVQPESDWQGQVPSSWDSIALGRLYRRVKSTGYQDEELLSVYRDHGVIPKSSRDDNFNKPSEDLSPYQLVKPGQVVMNKMKAWQGSIAVSEFRGIVSPAYFVYDPLAKTGGKVNNRYIHYLLRSPIYISQYLRQSKGIRVSQWDLDPEAFEKIEILLPTKKEQKQIAAFLDYETAKIDALIEKQQQLITLLGEKRQAVISHAVTKGLNPDVPMRDSGVEWLGEVPEHWEVKRLKHLCKIQSGIAKGRGETGSTVNVPMLRVANVQDGWLDLHEIHEIPVERSQLDRYLLRDGDVLMNEGGDRDKLGRGAIWNNQIAGCIHQNHVFAIRPVAIESEWLTLVTRANYAKYHFYQYAKQSTNLASISSTNIKETPLVIPPSDERVKIVSYILEFERKAETTTLLAKEKCELLQERRSALISAAVTGKIDVRNWKPPTDDKPQKPKKEAA